MMNKLKAKLKNQGGFTLIEMLIVVAIIAILIAVSIPLVGSALESAREATDAANERAFKAALVSGYLLTEADMTPAGDVMVNAGTLYAYDAVNGRVSETDITDGYGKSDATTGTSDADCKGKVLYGTVTASGEVYMTWETGKGNAVGTTGGALPGSGDLVSTDMMKETT